VLQPVESAAGPDTQGSSLMLIFPMGWITID